MLRLERFLEVPDLIHLATNNCARTVYSLFDNLEDHAGQVHVDPMHLTLVSFLGGPSHGDLYPLLLHIRSFQRGKSALTWWSEGACACGAGGRAGDSPHLMMTLNVFSDSEDPSAGVSFAGSWPLLSHCSYHQHSERFVLAVTAGPPQREMLVWDRWSGHIHTVGLYSPRKDRMAFLHDDMHPAWSPDGCTLAFDSTHTGQGWQVCSAVFCRVLPRIDIPTLNRHPLAEPT